MKQGKEYELLVKKIYDQLAPNATVIHDDKIYDKSGKTNRQIDVSIRHEFGGSEYLTIIEVKDYSHRAGLTVVDAFNTVMHDVSANKGIIICAKGFTRHAIEKAKSLGIELLTFHSAQNKNWKTLLKAVVYRTRYEFYIDFNITSEFMPVKGGDIVHMESHFFSYNKRDIISINDIIRNELLTKYSIRDLKRKQVKVDLSTLNLYTIVNNSFLKIKEGFIIIQLLKIFNERFYIEPEDYIVKSNHINNENKVESLTFNIELTEKLISDNFQNLPDIIEKPDIEIIAYRFSNGGSTGDIKFINPGFISGGVVKKGNNIMKFDDNSKRIIELEEYFKNHS